MLETNVGANPKVSGESISSSSFRGLLVLGISFAIFFGADGIRGAAEEHVWRDSESLGRCPQTLTNVLKGEALLDFVYMTPRAFSSGANSLHKAWI